MFEGKFDKLKVPAALVAATTIGFGLGRFSMPSEGPLLSVDDIKKYEAGLRGQSFSIPGVRAIKIEDDSIILSDDLSRAGGIDVGYDESSKRYVKEMIAYEARKARNSSNDNDQLPYAIADVQMSDLGVVMLRGIRFPIDR